MNNNPAGNVSHAPVLNQWLFYSWPLTTLHTQEFQTAYQGDSEFGISGLGMPTEEIFTQIFPTITILFTSSFPPIHRSLLNKIVRPSASGSTARSPSFRKTLSFLKLQTHKPSSWAVVAAALKNSLSRIQAFSDAHNLFPDFQHGFRKKTSQLVTSCYGPPTRFIIYVHRTTGGA
ncbi:hypothetical protein TNIN_446011 [Trichonephila inaurata madagascariensis]|uniref:Uncharacterized protein n=1 Tax=Trichonephila inaurata madagascariensis TaxID=2747483 RepID=A0A8X6Y3L3_9ARAC|nr:hypothetical protein TNIN_446011 [Trichonephila inaurata madagascariensis]